MINILGIFLIVIITIFLLITFIINKNDNEIQKNKIYKIGISRHFVRLCMPINWFLISILFFPLGILAIIMFTSKNYLVGFIGIAITICSIILFYFSILAFMLHKQYFKIEKDRAITFDKEQKSITILNTKNSNKIILTENNIKGIEINLYTGNQRKPISEYEYVKYCTNENDEIIITSLQTNISNLDNFFKGAKRNSIYRKINWIQ